MPCTELPTSQASRLKRLAKHAKRWAGFGGAGALGIVAGCSTTPTATPDAGLPSTQASVQSSSSYGAGALPPPGAVRNWNELRLQAAQRMVSANPSMTYLGVPPEPLLAIPVLEVELNADGSIRRIEVMRQPSQATDTVKLATDAVRRAAPFGDVSRLPKPWRFTETFLFDDDRKFKPRSLDQ